MGGQAGTTCSDCTEESGGLKMVGRIVVVIVLQVDIRQNQDQIKVKTLGNGGKKGGGSYSL